MLTDENGNVAERYEYDAYGEPVAYTGFDDQVFYVEVGGALATSAVGNPFQHQGLFRDGETGTYQNRFRQYHSRSGRFMQVTL